MTLFEILSHDERIIVLSNEGDQTIYTWNRSLTLQCWAHYRGGIYEGVDRWDEVDMRTLDKEPANFQKAKEAAQVWQGTRWEG